MGICESMCVSVCVCAEGNLRLGVYEYMYTRVFEYTSGTLCNERTQCYNIHIERYDNPTYLSAYT